MVGDFMDLKSDRKSFTVVEVLITAIIISLLVILGIPNFRKAYRRLKFENTVQRIYSFCHYGYNHALTKRKLLLMEIKPDENELVLKLGKSQNKILQIPDNYSIESDLSKVGFGYFDSFELHDFDSSNKQMKPDGYIKLKDENSGWEAEIHFYAYWGGIVLKKL
jgi:Tfp pilus assembly protein FimT